MVYYSSNYLCHYGLKGMKWGVRRWQNSDGSFNAAGKARYFSRGGGENYHKIGRRNSGVSGGLGNKIAAKVYDVNERYYSKRGNKAMASANRKAKEAQLKKYEDKNTPEAKAKRAENLKKAAKIGAVAAGTALAAYGAYKLHQTGKDKELIAAAQNFMSKASTKAKMAGYEALGRADNAVQSARKAAGEAADKAREVAGAVSTKAKMAGYEALGRADNAAQSARKAAGEAADKAREVAGSAANKARQAGYEALGRADNAAQSARKAASNVATRARNASTKAQIEAQLGAYRVLGDKGFNAARNAAQGARNAASSAASAARRTAGNAAGRASDIGRAASNRARQAGYEVLGRADNAAQSARKAARNVSTRARNTATKAQIEAQLGAYRVLGDRGFNAARNAAQGARSAASSARNAVTQAQRNMVNAYKREHPNSSLSNRDILEMFSRRR